MTYRTADLNLLKVFEALMTEGNVTRAARKLSLTQPTVSNALRRLRETFDDPLFVRSGAGVNPTRRAIDCGSRCRSRCTPFGARWTWRASMPCAAPPA